MHHNRKDKRASSFLSLYAFKPIIIFYLTGCAVYFWGRIWIRHFPWFQNYVNVQQERSLSSESLVFKPYAQTFWQGVIACVWFAVKTLIYQDQENDSDKYSTGWDGWSVYNSLSPFHSLPAQMNSKNPATLFGRQGAFKCLSMCPFTGC